VLSDIQQQAIITCLTNLDRRTERTYPWPGPNLLAILRENDVEDHPDPTARELGVAPFAIPNDFWDQPGGPIAALCEANSALHHPHVQATLAIASAADIRVLGWVFMHTDTVDDDELGPRQVRRIDAVDIDDRTYAITRQPDQPTASVAVYVSGENDDSRAVAILRTLARNLRTG